MLELIRREFLFSIMKNETNFNIELGRRIKERRKKLGITQAQLCGEYITRNMLSRIETGNASPSLDTLMFISQKLKMPPSYFLCRDIKEEAEYTKTVRIKDARRMLGTGQYKKCIDICRELPSDDDEVSFIIVNAEIMNAISDFDKGMISESKAHIENAKTALHQTVYMYSEMHSQIKIISLLIRSLSQGETIIYSELPASPPPFFTKDRYFYITALSLDSEGSDNLIYSNTITDKSVYKEHLDARNLLKERKYAEARSTLENLYAEGCDAYTMYFILLDLEKACRLSEDYKAAYQYAQIRVELHEKYNA